MVDNYKEFSLFNEIEDVNLRNRNRAVVMTNLAEDHKNKENRIGSFGVKLILGYFNCLPKEDRADVLERFKKGLEERKFQIVPI